LVFCAFSRSPHIIRLEKKKEKRKKKFPGDENHSIFWRALACFFLDPRSHFCGPHADQFFSQDIFTQWAHRCAVPRNHAAVYQYQMMSCHARAERRIGRKLDHGSNRPRRAVPSAPGGEQGRRFCSPPPTCAVTHSTSFRSPRLALQIQNPGSVEYFRIVQHSRDPENFPGPGSPSALVGAGPKPTFMASVNKHKPSNGISR